MRDPFCCETRYILFMIRKKLGCSYSSDSDAVINSNADSDADHPFSQESVVITHILPQGGLGVRDTWKLEEPQEGGELEAIQGPQKEHKLFRKLNSLDKPSDKVVRYSSEGFFGKMISGGDQSWCEIIATKSINILEDLDQTIG